MELWKKSDERAEAAGSAGSKEQAAGAIVVTGGARVAGAGPGAEKAVARVAASAPASPGGAGVRKATTSSARVAAPEARPEIRPDSALPSFLKAAQVAAPVAGPALSRAAGVRTSGEARTAGAVAGTGAPSLVPHVSGTATLSQACADLFGDDDGPILIVESLPPSETLFDRAPVPLQERTFHVRYDSAAVAGIVGALLLSVAFMLGRTSGTSVAEAQAPPVKAPEATRAPEAPGEATGRSAARTPRETGFEAEPETAPAAHVADAAGASPDAGGDPSGAEATASTAGASTGGAPEANVTAAGASAGASSGPATAAAEFGIMVVGGIPRKNADAVAVFMGKQGFQTRIVGTGNRCGVIVGGYPDKKGAAIEGDLERVRALKYVDGQKPFAAAYAYPLKK